MIMKPSVFGERRNSQTFSFVPGGALPDKIAALAVLGIEFRARYDKRLGALTKTDSSSVLGGIRTNELQVACCIIFYLQPCRAYFVRDVGVMGPAKCENRIHYGY